MVPRFTNTVEPFHNLQPSLYWTGQSGGSGGEKTFSFLSGLIGQSTTKYNYFYLLPRLAAGAVLGVALGLGLCQWKPSR
ncbi:MAG TPA: hypothetical protein VJ860_21500 [Polyangia bacterium]|nr:hypothetical protein [Polyangia bacterium]